MILAHGIWHNIKLTHFTFPICLGEQIYKLRQIRITKNIKGQILIFVPLCPILLRGVCTFQMDKLLCGPHYLLHHHQDQLWFTNIMWSSKFACGCFIFNMTPNVQMEFLDDHQKYYPLTRMNEYSWPDRMIGREWCVILSRSIFLIIGIVRFDKRTNS